MFLSKYFRAVVQSGGEFTENFFEYVKLLT